MAHLSLNVLAVLMEGYLKMDCAVARIGSLVCLNHLIVLGSVLMVIFNLLTPLNAQNVLVFATPVMVPSIVTALHALHRISIVFTSSTHPQQEAM
jgi:hypothetical protein